MIKPTIPPDIVVVPKSYCAISVNERSGLRIGSVGPVCRMRQTFSSWAESGPSLIPARLPDGSEIQGIRRAEAAIRLECVTHIVDHTGTSSAYRRANDYIEGHLNGHLTLTDLASVTDLSPFHFSRSFKQAVGIGPWRYVMQRRLERAKTLMRRTNRSLALIAQDIGFADQSHFTSVFHKEIGVTPGRFRTGAP
jgi:AraC-like DNA-binding protein